VCKQKVWNVRRIVGRYQFHVSAFIAAVQRRKRKRKQDNSSTLAIILLRAWLVLESLEHKIKRESENTKTWQPAHKDVR